MPPTSIARPGGQSGASTKGDEERFSGLSGRKRYLNAKSSVQRGHEARRRQGKASRSKADTHEDDPVQGDDCSLGAGIGSILPDLESLRHIDDP